MRHVDLDPVCTMIKLLPGGFACLDWSVNNLHAFGHRQLWRVTFQGVSTGRGNRERRDEQPRAGNIPAFDRLLDPHIPVAGTFCIHIAKGCEPLLERPPHRNRCPRRPVRHRIFQNVGIVSAFRRILTLQEDVGMGIDGKQFSVVDL